MPRSWGLPPLQSQEFQCSLLALRPAPPWSPAQGSPDRMVTNSTGGPPDRPQGLPGHEWRRPGRSCFPAPDLTYHPDNTVCQPPVLPFTPPRPPAGHACSLLSKNAHASHLPERSTRPPLCTADSRLPSGAACGCTWEPGTRLDSWLLARGPRGAEPISGAGEGTSVELRNILD